jgi:5-methylcytosine-specific restriction endonuclease McrA
MREWHGSNWIRKAKRLRIYERDGHLCLYCGATDHLSLDHFQPVARGGTNHANNLFTACRSCNSARGHRPVKAFCDNDAIYQSIINARNRKL